MKLFETHDRRNHRGRRCSIAVHRRSRAGQGAVLPAAVPPHGPYAPNGTPWANGKQDYLKMINARDGGINGVKITLKNAKPATPPTAAWNAMNA